VDVVLVAIAVARPRAGRRRRRRRRRRRWRRRWRRRRIWRRRWGWRRRQIWRRRWGRRGRRPMMWGVRRRNGARLRRRLRRDGYHRRDGTCSHLRLGLRWVRDGRPARRLRDRLRVDDASAGTRPKRDAEGARRRREKAGEQRAAGDSDREEDRRNHLLRPAHASASPTDNIPKGTIGRRDVSLDALGRPSSAVSSSIVWPLRFVVALVRSPGSIPPTTTG